MRVGILGALEVEHDGHPVVVAGGRLRALLARLALDAGRPVGAGALVDAVWDGDLPADHVHALQSLVSRLRRALGDPELIAPAPGGYRLAVEPDAVDAHRFERLAADGAAALRAGDPERAARLLGEALALWRGPLPEELEPRATAALEDARLAAAADRAAAELALGRGERLVGELEALNAEHPLHERIAARLIAALYAAGRQADALAAYERVRTRLADELGASPSPELQAAHLAVLRGETAAPARPAGGARRSNLRAPVTSFVGREAEIARVGELLERSRLVTLLGPGGAGKTRLAGEAVGRWVDRVPDGVWMVELAPVTDEVEIVPALLGALQLREAALAEGSMARRDGLDRALDVLADRETIVVLDNCEHLIGAVAELADRLLGECPRLRIVATSREPLAIAGESLAPVPPLGLPDADAANGDALAPALQLFADRAAAAVPGFRVDESNVAAVSEICRRLDGLPLAIELAAARLRSMPVERLAEGLNDRFRLLTLGSRTALPRHRTLRAVVDWSWDLLSEEERRLARRLAVFAGGATEASAAAVAEDAAVLDGLAALVDRSLLQVVPETSPQRYRMLETIREYGLEKLAEAGELEATRAAHARCFAALAEEADPQLRGRDQLEWFRRLDGERDNVLAALRTYTEAGDARAALRLTVTLLWYWLISGTPDEATAWIETAVGLPGDADPVDRMIAEGIHVASQPEANLVEEMRAALERVDAVPDDDRPLLALAKPVLAAFTLDMAEADRRLDVALEHPDPWVHATVYLFRSQVADNRGDMAGQEADLERAVAAYRELGDRWGLTMSYNAQAGVRMVTGDLDGAEAALEQARELMNELNARVGETMLYRSLSDVRMRRGDVAGAREAVLHARELGNHGGDDEVFMLAMLARIEWAAGEFEASRSYIDEALEQLERLPSHRPEQGHGRALALAQTAMLDLEAGELETARERLVEAYVTATGLPDMPIVAAVGTVVAAAAERHGDAAGAAELLGAAAALRGSEDASAPEVKRVGERARAVLGEAAFAAAYARGAALEQAAAAARLDPSRAAPVGP